jgi:hypothetical protein
MSSRHVLQKPEASDNRKYPFPEGEHDAAFSFPNPVRQVLAPHHDGFSYYTMVGPAYLREDARRERRSMRSAAATCVAC